MDQDAYMIQFDQLSERYGKITEKTAAMEKAIQDIQSRKTKTDLFLETLTKQESIVTEFSSDLWHTLADHATVYSKEDVRFTFKNGIEIKA